MGPYGHFSLPGGEAYFSLKSKLRQRELHTICESARCPNMGECWEHRTATFMILGNICTRACGFCAVPSGRPLGPPEEDEPERVAEAAESMGLRYAVVTSVNRDDQPDGGAHIFARTIEGIRRRIPDCKIEVLIPDFRGVWEALDVVVAARPDVLAQQAQLRSACHDLPASPLQEQRMLRRLHRVIDAEIVEQHIER